MTETITYRLIGADDLNAGIGTFDATLADGSVITMKKVSGEYIPELLGDDIVNVNNYASLPAALSIIGTSPVTLMVCANITVSTAVSIPSNITVWVNGSGKFTKSGAGTITFNGPFDAPLRQVFSGFAAGDIAFARGSVSEIFLQWFGAKGDGATADDAPIVNAMSAVTVSGIPIKVIGDFAITTQSGASLIDNVHFVGISHVASIFRCTTASRQNAFRYNGTASPILNFSAENIHFIGNAVYAANTFDFGYGIFLRYFTNAVIRNNKFTDFPIAAVEVGTYVTSQSTDYTFEHNIVTVSGALRPMIGTSIYHIGGKINILDNKFSKVARAINSETTSGAYILHDVLIDGNFVELGEVSSISATNIYQGILFDWDSTGNRVHNLRITDNTFYSGVTAAGNASADIAIIGVASEEVFANFSMSGNQFYKSDIPQYLYLYKLVKPSVTGNTFNGIDSGSFGINLLSVNEGDVANNVFQGTFNYDIIEDSSNVPDKCKYRNNTLSGTGNGIGLQSTSKSIIQDNTFNHGYQTVAFSTPLTPNPMLGNFIKIGALTGNITINLPAAANIRNGHIMSFELIQDGTGGRTVTFAAGYYKAGGAYTMTAAAGSTDIITFLNDGGSWLELGRNQDIK